MSTSGGSSRFRAIADGLHTASSWRSSWVGLGLVLVLWLALSALGGRLNDGGWYLLAARSVGRLEVLYRDFPFPHPPLAAWSHLPAVLVAPGVHGVFLGRLWAATLSLAGVGLAVVALPAGRTRKLGALTALGLLTLDPYTVYFLTLVKSYPATCLSLGATLWSVARGRFFVAGLFLGLGLGVRLSLAAAVPALLWATPSPRRAATFAGGILGTSLAYLPSLWFAGTAMSQQLYLPMIGIAKVNSMTDLYVYREVGLGLWPWIQRALGSLLRLLWTHPVALLLLATGRIFLPQKDSSVRFAMAAVLMVGGAQMAARRPYDDYQVVLAPLVFYLIARALGECLSNAPTPPVSQPLLPPVLCAIVLSSPGIWRGLNRIDASPRLALTELERAASLVRRHSAPGDTVLSLDAYLVFAADREPVAGLELGRFGLLRKDSHPASGSRGIPLAALIQGIHQQKYPLLWLPSHDPEDLDPVEKLSAAALAGYRPIAQAENFGERGQQMVLWTRK